MEADGMAVAQRETQTDAEVPARTFLIDTDVHEMLTSPQQLLPYLAPEWRLWMQETTLTSPRITGTHGYAVPVPKNAHPEWVGSDGTKATDLEKLAHDLFD